jgi:hypothetical protein
MVAVTSILSNRPATAPNMTDGSQAMNLMIVKHLVNGYRLRGLRLEHSSFSMGFWHNFSLWFLTHPCLTVGADVDFPYHFFFLGQAGVSLCLPHPSHIVYTYLHWQFIAHWLLWAYQFLYLDLSLLSFVPLKNNHNLISNSVFLSLWAIHILECYLFTRTGPQLAGFRSCQSLKKWYCTVLYSDSKVEGYIDSQE